MNNWDGLSDDSKIWLYGTNREISAAENDDILAFLDKFCDEWAAHGAKLDCGFAILHNRLIVLGVDERSAAASGCSIDKSVHAFQSIDQQYDFDLFNRLRSYQLNETGLESLSNTEIKEKMSNAELNASSHFVDPLVSTIGALKSGLIKPLSETWLKKYLPQA